MKIKNLKINDEIAFVCGGKVWIGNIVCFKREFLFGLEPIIFLELNNLHYHPDYCNGSGVTYKSNVTVILSQKNYKKSLNDFVLDECMKDSKFSGELQHYVWCFPDSKKYLNHVLNAMKRKEEKRLKNSRKWRIQKEKAVQVNFFINAIEKIVGNNKKVWILDKCGKASVFDVDVVFYDNHYYIKTKPTSEISPTWIRLEKFEQSFFLTESDCLNRHRSLAKSRRESKIYADSSKDKSSMLYNFVYDGVCGACATFFPNLRTVYLTTAVGIITTGWNGIKFDEELIYNGLKNAINERADGDPRALKLIDEMKEDKLLESLRNFL